MHKKHKNYLWVALAAVAVVAIFYFMSGGAASTKYDEFAQCVSNSGTAMYGAYWCPHCQDQKKEFGDSWNKINYVECDPRGDSANPELCTEKGIEGYPTWVFGNGQKLSGKLSMNTIASQTGCTLP